MKDGDPVTSLQRPYLLRAMHEWMTDNNLTPHIVIDVAASGESRLPMQFAKDGKLIVNVSYSATQDLHIGNDFVGFNARFSGVSHRLDVPILAVLGIYARESGQGMIFANEEQSADSQFQSGQAGDANTTDSVESPPTQSAPQKSPASTGGATNKKSTAKPTLKIVK